MKIRILALAHSSHSNSFGRVEIIDYYFGAILTIPPIIRKHASSEVQNPMITFFTAVNHNYDDNR